MKKVILTMAIISVIASACTSEPKKQIVSIEPLPTGQCVYSVAVKDSASYTFIDACGEFAVGEKF